MLSPRREHRFEGPGSPERIAPALPPQSDPQCCLSVDAAFFSGSAAEAAGLFSPPTPEGVRRAGPCGGGRWLSSRGWQKGFTTSIRAGGWGRQSSPCVPGGVPLLLTGIRFSHMWAPGSSPASPEARGRSPRELRELPRGHFEPNFDPLGRLWDHFWITFRKVSRPAGVRSVATFIIL